MFDYSIQNLLRRRDVEARTGLSRSSIYALMNRGEFPWSVRRIHLWILLRRARMNPAFISKPETTRRRTRQRCRNRPTFNALHLTLIHSQLKGCRQRLSI